jgi:dipeptide/tripeptide permease
MTVDHVSSWLMIAFGGLFAGGIFFVAVERTNLWQRMPVEQYAIDFRRSLYRLDPLMPILGAVSALGAVVFALNTGGPAAAMAWIGVTLIAVIMFASIAVAEPMNSKFRRLPEGQAPDGAEELRVRWRRFHLTRTVIALVALGCLAAAAATV